MMNKYNERKNRGGGGIKMKKKIISYIALVMVISSISLIFLFSNLIKQNELNSEKAAMKTILNQMLVYLQNNEEARQKARNLFTEDYLNRTGFIKYLISQDKYQDFSENDWQEINQVIDVSAIYLVNHDGVIVESSSPKSLGLDFHDNDELKEFLPIIEKTSQENYHIEFDNRSATDNEHKIYLGISLDSKKYSMLQLEIDENVLADYEDFTSLQNYVASVPTKTSRAIFVCDQNKELIAITENNEQTLEIQNKEEVFQRALNQCIETTVNGKQQLLELKEFESYYVGYISDISNLYKNAYQYIWGIIAILILLSLFIVLVLYYCINQIVLKDVDMLTNKALRFVKGDSNVTFELSKTKELNQLGQALNNVFDAIKSKSDRISMVASLMGNGFGAYEYYADLNQIYYSDNLPDIMAVTPERLKEMIKEAYIAGKVKAEKGICGLDEKIILESGKIVNIRRTILNNVSYAFIQDITDSENTRIELEETLEEQIKTNHTDVLTGIKNRKWIQECVELFIQNSYHTVGGLLLMDLDNFKRVNDEAGHIVGDEVLIEFAKLLTKHFREVDIKARIGGDEFMIFLPNAIPEDVFELKIQTFIESCRKELSCYYTQYHLSVSVGVIFVDQSYTSFDQVYKDVDEAMYQAKRMGKDCYYIKK